MILLESRNSFMMHQFLCLCFYMYIYIIFVSFIVVEIYFSHSVFFRITYASLTFHSKWLYVGTERGNVHVVNVESFILSGYVINWNKAVEM